jgi:hypothetical protein
MVNLCDNFKDKVFKTSFSRRDALISSHWTTVFEVCKVNQSSRIKLADKAWRKELSEIEVVVEVEDNGLVNLCFLTFKIIAKPGSK